MKSTALTALALIIFITGAVSYIYPRLVRKTTSERVNRVLEKVQEQLKTPPHELSIESLRSRSYDGGDLVVEQTLDPGANYNRYIVSYQSDGNKIYALLTIPNGEKPVRGWPVVVFNHGYIPPSQYRTTERYIAYVDDIARSGYMVLRSDYRGHGSSEGDAVGAYGSNAYTIDVLNAVSAIKKHRDANPQRIGMWGHSLGGFITLRAMVTQKDIKAGVIWAGVVGSYPDLISRWRRRPTPAFPAPSGTGGWRQNLVSLFGTPENNPIFWKTLSANSYLADIGGPLQLHHGTGDTSVPVEFSQKLAEELKVSEKEGELHLYPGDDHNISGYYRSAMDRTIDFFDKQLKSEPDIANSAL